MFGFVTKKELGKIVDGRIDGVKAELKRKLDHQDNINDFLLKLPNLSIKTCPNCGHETAFFKKDYRLDHFFTYQCITCGKEYAEQNEKKLTEVRLPKEGK